MHRVAGDAIAYAEKLEAELAEKDREIARLHDSIEMLESLPGNELIAAKDAEIDRLRNAIRRHCENVWGERGGIYHDEDIELYAELGEELQTDE